MTINIETENAGTYPDVDETQVLSLSDRLADGMIYLIAHDSTRDLEYAQASRWSSDEKDRWSKDSGKYVVEYHDADDYHYQAIVTSTAEVGAFLAAWAWQRDGWKDGYKWKELVELRGANQPR